MDQRVAKAGPIPSTISLEEYNKGWKKQKEHTAAVSAGLSFSEHKAAIDNPDMAEINQLQCEIPYTRGFSPKLYQNVTDFEIFKEACL
jgi:hypothetical protein